MWRPFLCSKLMEDNKEELRPSKMRGVAFPKAKYGAILAVIVIIVVNLIYYKETILSFFDKTELSTFGICKLLISFLT